MPDRADTSRTRSRSITVRASPQAAYEMWRNFENLPRFMPHLDSVRELSHGRSLWRATGPGGKTIEWESQLLEDRPGERISWRSVEGSDVEHSGTVRFRPAPGGRGTEVRVELEYDPSGGRLGVILAKLTRKDPRQQLYDDLRAFKQILEIGEVLRSDSTLRPADPAQPDEHPDATYTRAWQVQRPDTRELR